MSSLNPLKRTQVHELLRDLGAEQHLAKRLMDLRKERGWSQDRLAEKMARVGCPIPQSAISKIEKPAAGGRRAISVDEALALSKVFEIPLDELLLPATKVDEIRALQDLQEGVERLRALQEATRQYEAVVTRVVDYMLESPGWAKVVKDELEDLDYSKTDRWELLVEVVDRYAERGGVTRHEERVDEMRKRWGK